MQLELYFLTCALASFHWLIARYTCIFIPLSTNLTDIQTKFSQHFHCLVVITWVVMGIKASQNSKNNSHMPDSDWRTHARTLITYKYVWFFIQKQTKEFCCSNSFDHFLHIDNGARIDISLTFLTKIGCIRICRIKMGLKCNITQIHTKKVRYFRWNADVPPFLVVHDVCVPKLLLKFCPGFFCDFWRNNVALSTTGPIKVCWVW